MKKALFYIVLFIPLFSIAQVQVNEICPNNVNIVLDCSSNSISQIPIDLTAFPKGIYLCEVKGESVREVFSLISK